jgi:hypothetical protein
MFLAQTDCTINQLKHYKILTRSNLLELNKNCYLYNNSYSPNQFILDRGMRLVVFGAVAMKADSIILLYEINTVKPAHAVTSIKHVTF